MKLLNVLQYFAFFNLPIAIETSGMAGTKSLFNYDTFEAKPVHHKQLLQQLSAETLY